MITRLLEVFLLFGTLLLTGCISSSTIPTNSDLSPIEFSKELVKSTTAMTIEYLVHENKVSRHEAFEGGRVYSTQWCPNRDPVNDQNDVVRELNAYCLKLGGEILLDGVCTKANNRDGILFSFMTKSLLSYCYTDRREVWLSITEPTSTPISVEFLNKLEATYGYKTTVTLAQEQHEHEEAVRIRKYLVERRRKEEIDEQEKRSLRLEKARELTLHIGDSVCTRNNYLGFIEGVNPETGKYLIRMHAKALFYKKEWALAVDIKPGTTTSSIIHENLVWLDKSEFVWCDVHPSY